MKQIPKETIEVMKQMLKDTIEVWMVVIIGLACDCIVVGAPFVFLYYVGFGDWQNVVCGLYFTFWVSLAVATEISRELSRYKE